MHLATMAKKLMLPAICLVLFAFPAVASEADKTSVTLYDNEGDGALWVHIRKPYDDYHELIVYLPDGKSVYLVSYGQDIIPQLANFAHQFDFRMPVNDLIGIYYDKGVAVKTRVFNQKGNYSFYFAGNVETEPENTVHDYIKVTYPPK